MPVTHEMERLMRAERFDVHELVAQKSGVQKAVDPKCAKRFMKPLQGIDFEFQVLRANLMATTKRGQRQFTHFDMSPELAREKGVYVYIQNLGTTSFVIYIRNDGVDVPVTVPPGMAITFPADTPHAGSGEIHYYRLYVLFAALRLSSDEVREIILDSDSLIAAP